jgi:uncharacterized membrane protein (UPF0127 family)
VIILRVLFLAALLLPLSGCKAEQQAIAARAADTGVSQTGLQRVPLIIHAHSTDHRFTVEVAATFDQQERGLMFREHVGPEEGMIFPFRTPRPATFWMKNTIVPLDMLFIRPDGTIARIAANTTPYSLDPVGVGEPVASVLEIAGGRAAQLGIEEGDTVEWRQP